MAGVKWLDDLEAQLSGIDISPGQISKKHSIFRVPAPFKDASINSYEPQTVSIGPYHHGKPNLKPMEHHKRRVVAQFLKRTGKNIRVYANALDSVVEDLMGAYEELDEEWRNKERFLQLMLIDGCFLLQSFHVMDLSFAPPDPILGRGHLSPEMIVLRDIMMLENQIPLLALVKLRWIQETSFSMGEAEVSIHNLFKRDDSIQIRGEILHLLHLFREEFIYDPRSIPSIYNSARLYKSIASIPSATKLQEAGVVFRSSPKRYTVYYGPNIAFENGVLTLPILMINEVSGAVHRNLMMLERCRRDIGYDLTTYWAFMSGLVNSVQDVALLRSKGLIVHQLESDEAVAELIEDLGKDADFDYENRLNSIGHSLNEYYNDKKMEKWSRRFRKWRLNLT